MIMSEPYSSTFIKQSLIDEINRLLLVVTEEQRTFFFKIFPQFPIKCDVDQLKTALDLVHRTVVKNQET